MSDPVSIPSVWVTCSRDGSAAPANVLTMRPMQERCYQKRGEQYLLIKSPPASGKSRALMFIALDKLVNQKLKQAIVVVPGRSIGDSFHDEPLSQFGFWAHWKANQSGISATRRDQTPWQQLSVGGRRTRSHFQTGEGYFSGHYYPSSQEFHPLASRNLSQIAAAHSNTFY